MAGPTETRKTYQEAKDKLLAVARAYVHVPEADEALEAAAVEALKEAAVDFHHAEKAAWEAGDFNAVHNSPTF